MIGTRVLEEKKSKYNGELRVVKTLGMGTYIQSNGLTQSGGIVKTIWKQILGKIKSKSQGIKSVLILGLGGGTVAGLIWKKWKDVKITGIEIDPMMIKLGKKYLGLDEGRTQIIVEDAYKFVLANKTKYDLIIVDLYNGDTFPKQFEEEKFIVKLTKSISKDGRVIFNRLYFGDKRPETVKFGNRLKDIFSEVEWYYPEANLMFICSK